uniref:Uncharacterized protein n=1 Tax=Paramoeba aestuarina TaxID=180227 RepID=A0A7S4KJ78_9EUKA|mmetsp:Transcript_20156/g.31554  ORF Transcript_20156/g.31554 Transcript_20156/m.31554 type:complete len:227 (+) Transcript_20156:67-747(+)
MAMSKVGLRHKEAYRILIDVRSQLERLEAFSSSLKETSPHDLKSRFRADCDAMKDGLNELEKKVELARCSLAESRHRLGSGKGPDTWEIRLNEMSKEVVEMRNCFAALQKRCPIDLKEAKAQLFDGTTVHIDMGYAGEQRDLLDSSNRIADQLIEQGLGIHSKLTSQGDIMKGARKKLLDMGVTMGLSNSVLRMIEQREFTDKVIVLVGIIVTSLFLYFFYYFVKG